MKTEEFVAHSTNVNCLSIAKKGCRLFVTGSDDCKVNLWSVGTPDSLMSLCGHASPVESVAFNTAEVLVLGGASTGVMKLWDLEESKMVRTLNGHRSNCTAIEFHPFGEFFASGSADTNLKIWDIRSKGCINTYKGHTQGINTIRFTPDGRWIVSGGFDNTVKVWDLTAGKLLHSFNDHEGHIRSIDFHPLEFLLATGSADRTVKFWDLETFELIGSGSAEAAGVRAISFHPDGRTLFCGLDDSLKVYSWEPVICHDTIDMVWSTLADLCIHEQKVLACSKYRNSVAVWVADISLVKPYGANFAPEETEHIKQNFNKSPSPLEKAGSGLKSSSSLRCRSPDYEMKEIKNIYVDNIGSLNFPKAVATLDSKEGVNQIMEESPLLEAKGKPYRHTRSKSLAVPTVLPSDATITKGRSISGRETVNFARTKPGMLLRPAHVRRPSIVKNDVEKLQAALETESFSDTGEKKEATINLKAETIVLQKEAGDSFKVTDTNTKSATEKLERAFSPESPSKEKKSISKGKTSVKIVNGVAVVAGKTRSLVQRFERQQRYSYEDRGSNPTHNLAEVNQTGSSLPTVITNSMPESSKISNTASTTPCITPEKDKTPMTASDKPHYEKPLTDKISTTLVTPATKVIAPEVDRTVVGTNIGCHDDSAMHRQAALATNVTPCRVICEMDTSPNKNEDPQVSGRDLKADCPVDVTKALLETHDEFLSTVKLRLTKLKMVQHFWKKGDVKGAIDALKKLPDPSVQADIVSVLMGNQGILNLDLFSSLLPVLVSMLHSKIERHACVSMEMLLKLIAVFGPVIRSTVSAPRPVGVDLHAEQRKECCNRCLAELQKIQQMLPAIIKKGGLLAKSAWELDLVLQLP